jgi:Zn finger protein HypA/HybF involved in hydrogenase expression
MNRRIEVKRKQRQAAKKAATLFRCRTCGRDVKLKDVKGDHCPECGAAPFQYDVSRGGK